MDSTDLIRLARAFANRCRELGYRDTEEVYDIALFSMWKQSENAKRRGKRISSRILHLAAYAAIRKEFPQVGKEE